VLDSWRSLARAVRRLAGALGLAVLPLAPEAAAAGPAPAALPLAPAVAGALAATSAASPTAKPRSKSRRSAAGAARRAARAKKRTAAGRARGSRTASRRERRSEARSARERRGRTRAAARTARRGRTAAREVAVDEPTLDLPAVALPELAMAASPNAAAAAAAMSWEAALAGVAGGAGSAPATPQPGPLAAWTRSASSLLDGLVARARSQLGTRYVYGGAAPGAELDCSSFVRYVMEALDVRLPRTANQQARVGRPVPRDPSQLRPGDLLTFGRGRRTSHVGIYLGEGRFIHASVKSGQVIETTIERNGSLFRRWQGARRLLAAADSLAEGDGG
jgi:cell wall-associated NlpC family hydrolase